MRNANRVPCILVIVAALVVSGAAMAGTLEDFLHDVDVTAHADLGTFKSDLRVTFGISDGKVSGLFEVVSRPSDVYMCLRVGEVAHQPLDHVVEVYERYKGQGWGVIAKNLGIKPGSAEFHALKDGRLATHRGGGAQAKHGKGGKGKK